MAKKIVIQRSVSARAGVAAMLLVAIASAPNHPGFAEELLANNPPVVLILDASGSMERAFRRGARVDLLRRFLADLVANMPGRLTPGFLYIGGYALSGCGRTVPLARPGEVDRAVLRARLPSLELLAVGKTPLARALAEAASLLPPQGPARLVLLSDGDDTCGGDPVRTARALVRKRPGLRIHTVSLTREPDGALALAAVAAAGRGRYHEVFFEEAYEHTLRRLVEALH